MRAFTIVNLNEGIEAILLLQRIKRDRLGDCFLEGYARAISTAVIFRWQRHGETRWA